MYNEDNYMGPMTPEHAHIMSSAKKDKQINK